MNPFLTIWFEPRATIRSIVDSNPKRLVLVLAVLAGTLGLLMGALQLVQQLGTVANRILPWAGPAGALLGVIGLYFSGAIYTWVGKWFGGDATSEETRAAIAWSKVPALVLYAIGLVLFFAFPMPAGRHAAFSMPFIIFKIISAILGVWGFVIICKALGEVNHFSAWSGFGTIFMSGLIVSVPVFVLGLMAAIAIPNLVHARAGALSRRPAMVQDFQKIAAQLPQPPRISQGTRATQ